MSDELASIESSKTTAATAHVFPPQWIATQKRKKQGSLPTHQQSWFYRFLIAEDSRSRSLRETIEQWVDDLAPEKRNRVIGRLRGVNTFDQTYNELAVGNSLRQFGFGVEYEPTFAGKTPDWLVRARQGRFIVEVLTSNPNAEREKSDDGWKRLARRLETIPGAAILSVQPPHPAPDPTMDTCQFVLAPTDQRQEEIIRLVERWLGENPAPGAKFDINDIQIILSGRLPRASHVNVVLTLTPFWVDTAPLINGIREKMLKYRKLIEGEKIPFVVSVVADFGSGRGFDDLERAVFGARLDNTGLFQKYPALAAATLADQVADKIVHRVLYNPAPLFPLESWAFPQQ